MPMGPFSLFVRLLGRTIKKKTSFVFIVLMATSLSLLRYVSHENRQGVGEYLQRPSEEDYLTPEEYTETIQKLRDKISSPRSHCRRMLRLGGLVKCDCHNCTVDGGKLLCLDEDVRPPSRQCHALSFGMGFDMSFDRAMIRYGCRVTTFDPTIINMTNMVHPEGFQAVRLGIDATNHQFVQNFTDQDIKMVEMQKMTYMTFERIMAMLDYPDIQLIKIDVEGFEWKVFAQVIGSPRGRRLLRDVKQLMVEIHLDFLMKASNDPLDIYEETVLALDVLTGLEKLGFYLAAYELNEAVATKVAFGNLSIPVYREISLIKRPPLR